MVNDLVWLWLKNDFPWTYQNFQWTAIFSLAFPRHLCSNFDMLGISDPTLIVLSAAMTGADGDVKGTVLDGNVFATNILIIYCH